jgi:Immunoglobulin I-set domain
VSTPKTLNQPYMGVMNIMKTQKKRFITKCLAIWLGIVFSTILAAQAQTNIAVGVPLPADYRSDTYPLAGWAFAAPAGSSTTINALGYLDATGTGLLTSHVVAIYRYDGGSPYALVTKATIPAGTVAPLINGYRWISIPATNLVDNGQGGHYYLCVANHDQDTWSSVINSPNAFDSSFGSFVGSFNNGDVVGSPTIGFGGGFTGGYGGPNMAYFNPALPPLPLPVIVTNIQASASSVGVGDTAVFTAAFSNTPPVNLQWVFVNNSGTPANINTGVVTVTNNGIVLSTLTVANVQVSNDGTYHLHAVNANDSSSVIDTFGAKLTVAALINWVQRGTFADNSVLALAGSTANEAYGVDFGGSGLQTTANGYSFDDGQTSGNMTLALPGANYNNYLGGLTPTGDAAMDSLLTYGIYNNASSGFGGTLHNLTVGQTYNVLILLADDRTGAQGGQTAGVGFYGTDGVLGGFKQPFVFTSATNALGATTVGGYVLGTFTAISSNQPLGTVTQFSGGSTTYANCQYNAILLVKRSAPANSSPILLAQDIDPTSAKHGVGYPVSFSAAFKNIPALNLQWQVITNGVTNNINTGITYVTNSNNSVITSTLTVSNLTLGYTGNAYRLKAVNATNASDVVYSSSAPLTVVPAINWTAVGVFTNNSVLALAGPVSSEVYGLLFSGGALSTTQVTGNGYSFDDYTVSGNMTLSGSLSSYSGYLINPQGGTTGDAVLDTILTDGEYSGFPYTGTLNNLTVGQQYNVLVLLDDTRGGVVDGRTFTATDGAESSPAQRYAYTAGQPYVGGYALGTFTATGATQALSVYVSGGGGIQYNAILVTKAASVAPTLNAPKYSVGNLIVTGTGGTPNAGYTWLQTTSLTPPINWTTNTTGTLDGSGALSNAIPVNTSQSGGLFLRLRLP